MYMTVMYGICDVGAMTVTQLKGVGHRSSVAALQMKGTSNWLPGIKGSKVMVQSRRRGVSVQAVSGLDKDSVNKVVLAYSGGLDTSVILKWLQEEYDCEVVTFTADLGQGEELEPARRKAEAAGVKEIYIDDLREEFVRDFVWPMFRANATYEGIYLLGTSIARPLIAKRQIEIAKEVGADAVSWCYWKRK